MIYIELVTSLLIIYLIAYLTKLVTVILIIGKEDLKKIIADNTGENTLKRKKLNKIITHPTSFVVATKTAIAFLSMWLSAIVVELVAMPIYREMNILSISKGYSIKYILIFATVIVLSYVTFILTELLPKVIAIKNKEKILVKCMLDIYLLYYIFTPIYIFANNIEKSIMKMLGVRKEYEEIINDNEIKEVLEIEKEKGIISKRDRDIISNYLDIDSVQAEKIMVPLDRIEMININLTKEELKEKILTSGYSRLPVYDKNRQNIVGIINVKKILELILEKEKIDIKNIMKPCIFVPSGKRIDLLFNEMKNSQEHIVVISKNKNQAIGIVTMEDIIEELVGEITDDYEKYKKGMP